MSSIRTELQKLHFLPKHSSICAASEYRLFTHTVTSLTVSILLGVLRKHNTFEAVHICFLFSIFSNWEAFLPFSASQYRPCSQDQVTVFSLQDNYCKMLITKSCCEHLYATTIQSNLQYVHNAVTLLITLLPPSLVNLQHPHRNYQKTTIHKYLATWAMLR